MAKKLNSFGVETRPFFIPMHRLPIYKDSSSNKKYPVADKLAKQGINLPSHANLTNEYISYISEAVVELLKK